MRLWSPELNMLDQTYVYRKSTNVFGSELHGELISHLAWSSSGKFLSAAMEKSINIWPQAG